MSDMRYTVLVTDEDGTETAYGPFSEAKAEGLSAGMSAAFAHAHVRVRPLLTTSAVEVDEKLGILGHESALMMGLASTAHTAVHRRHPVTSLRSERRGYWFDVQVCDPDGEPTGHIARMSTELL